MSKNTLTAILMGFVICLGIVVIVLSVKLSIRPKAEPEPDLSAASNVFVEDNTNPADTPTPEPTPEPTSVPEVTTVTVKMVRTTTSVNVRAEPSASGTKLGTVVKGSEFVMIEEVGEGDNKWTKIEYESGEAYIKSSYLEQFEKEVEVTSTPAPEDAGDAPETGGEPVQ